MVRPSLVLVSALVASACASSPPSAPTPAASTPSAGHVSGAEAKKLVSQGAKLVDVRTPAEYAEKHVEGAINVPLDTLQAPTPNDLGPKDGAIVVYCHSGGRAERAATTLRGQGYTRVVVLGAMSRWDE